VTCQEREDAVIEREIADISLDARLAAAGIAVRDFATESRWQCHGDRWFHAASTIKVAILVALAAAIDTGRFELRSRLAVRNRFLSLINGEPYRIAAARDANAVVHAHIGRTMTLGELARHMITTSSNLATNLLLELVGINEARHVLSRLVEGIDLQRGVEDERAFAAGINNRVTPNGLLQLFECIHGGRAGSPAMTAWMIETLADQEFASGIPAGLPEDVRRGARVAHKTGEISNAAHDAGLVFLPDGSGYALAVLTEVVAGGTPSQQAVASLARAVYDHVVRTRAEGARAGE
jgi:beta-lactamase class A